MLPWPKRCRPVEESSEYKTELLKLQKEGLVRDLARAKLDLQFQEALNTRREKEASAPIYVPVISGHTKPYQELWNDKEYLETIVRFSQNKTIMSEFINVVAEIGKVRDNAETPEELKGINKCMVHAKNLLTLSKKASDKIAMVEYNKKAQAEAEANGGGFEAR